MNLTIFESDMGDCLLLEADSGELVLCDGGMKNSMQAQVRAELSRLRDNGRELELVYVSHIDNDHINGVLQLLEDEAEWRVFDLHQANGDPVRRPKVPRPPVIKGILHNSFLDQLRATNARIRDLKDIENALIASAPALYATAVPQLIAAADEMAGIASAIPEALKVSRLIASDALDIPLNTPPGVAQSVPLMYAGQPGDRFAIGSMQFILIGPTADELRRLGRGWATWLRNEPDRVREIRAQLKKRIEDFSTGAITGSPYDLRRWNGIPDVEGVSAPNVASLMFMVEENGRRLLLTGDAQQRFILDGLRRTGFLGNGTLHVDVLKVQHHGSENNMDDNFARTVTADHYVFCGNGAHGNPEREVIDRVFNARQGDNRPFHFWFSTTSQAAPVTLARRNTFADRERHVAGLAANSNGRLRLHFNQGPFIQLPI